MARAASVSPRLLGGPATAASPPNRWRQYVAARTARAARHGAIALAARQAAAALRTASAATRHNAPAPCMPAPTKPAQLWVM
eukprot:4157684-Lingulodinium_polyedra.AAC.1